MEGVRADQSGGPLPSQQPYTAAAAAACRRTRIAWRRVAREEMDGESLSRLAITKSSATGQRPAHGRAWPRPPSEVQAPAAREAAASSAPTGPHRPRPPHENLVPLAEVPGLPARPGFHNLSVRGAQHMDSSLHKSSEFRSNHSLAGRIAETATARCHNERTHNDHARAKMMLTRMY